MNECFIALGSNLNRPQFQLQRAIEALKSLPRTQVYSVAPFYKNPAYGRKVQPMFYNTVIRLGTSLSPDELLSFCQKIERRQGRQRKLKWGARTLDIDILLYANRKIFTDRLVVPHPEMQKRDFVLIPYLQLKSLTKQCKIID